MADIANDDRTTDNTALMTLSAFYCMVSHKLHTWAQTSMDKWEVLLAPPLKRRNIGKQRGNEKINGVGVGWDKKKKNVFLFLEYVCLRLTYREFQKCDKPVCVCVLLGRLMAPE